MKGVTYSSELTCIYNNGVQVAVLHRAGKYFKWQEQTNKDLLSSGKHKKENPTTWVVVDGHRG